MLRALLLCTLLLSAVGCGGETIPVPDLPPAGAEPELSDAISFVRITLAGESAAVHAAFHEQAPNGMVEVERAGSCRLLRGDPLSCGAWECSDGICVDGECVVAERLDAGRIELTGAGLDAAIDPVEQTGDYWYSEQGLDPDPIGDIAVRVEGAAYPGFETTITNVYPIEAPELEAVYFDTGDAVVLEWEAVDPSSRIRLELRTDLGHARVPPVAIQCDLPDTGSVTIPAGFADELADPDNWWCGICWESTLERYRKTTVPTALGDVDVTTYSARYFLPQMSWRGAG